MLIALELALSHHLRFPHLSQISNPEISNRHKAGGTLRTARLIHHCAPPATRSGGGHPASPVPAPVRGCSSRPSGAAGIPFLTSVSFSPTTRRLAARFSHIDKQCSR